MIHDDVCQLIMEERGRSFDPRVVDAFISIRDAVARMEIKIPPVLKIKGSL
jgi:response regulator RpfG family c-di-GMP phosphodiesterase